jgi:hypothetical protein
VRFCDELEFAFGWIADDDPIRRASHALVADGGVWLVDPLAWPEAQRRALELGPRGVIQLLDRHERDCAAIAQRLGVPHHRVPERIAGSPFEFLPIVGFRAWREAALWWPERRTLVTADALGTASYFRTRTESLGVHPFLRLRPPRSLQRVFPAHVLCGHGVGVHKDAAHALHEALRTSRRRLPAALLNSVRSRGAS